MLFPVKYQPATDHHEPMMVQMAAVENGLQVGKTLQVTVPENILCAGFLCDLKLLHMYSVVDVDDVPQH